ncbi:hypothetical protein PR048_008741 [Dryococelus australis]|uniref:Secreted protein n=1 Tax=Dryococelus australis TaxID=614101 RepID=A0ABQ9HXY5_9NEOP|nr:hypothetical protein PR048_008741 [Dryococelus australis]
MIARYLRCSVVAAATSQSQALVYVRTASAVESSEREVVRDPVRPHAAHSFGDQGEVTIGTRQGQQCLRSCKKTSLTPGIPHYAAERMRSGLLKQVPVIMRFSQYSFVLTIH